MSDLLRARRSNGRVLPERPSRESIERLLAAAVTAPNHHLTQPWRFFVIAGEARGRIGLQLRQILESHLPDPTAPTAQALLQKEQTKLLRAPVVIVVAVHPSTAPSVTRDEELAAGAAACQNILLQAEAEGLGAMWRTGETAYDPAVRRLFGLAPDDAIVGFIYVGYPDPTQPPPQRARHPWQSMTEWQGWDENSEADEIAQDQGQPARLASQTA